MKKKIKVEDRVMMMVGGEKIVKCENLIEIETDRNWRRAQFIEGWLITQGKPNENKSAKIYNLLESCAKKTAHLTENENRVDHQFHPA